MSRLLFTLLLLLSTLGLSAQTPTHVHYGTNQGVPSSQVYHLIQDCKGFIWLATDNGVSRFNGYDFRTFGVTDGLHSQVIFRMFEDHKGRIWFSNSSNTLSYFYNDSIFAFKFNHLIPEHPYSDTYKASLKSVYVDSADNVFVEWYHIGYSVIDSSGNYKYYSQANNSKIVFFEMGNTGKFCGNFPSTEKKISNEEQIEIVTPWQSEPASIKNTYYSNLTSTYYFERIKPSNHIFTIGNALLWYNENTVRKFELPAQTIALYPETDGNLWIGTIWRKGVYCYSETNGFSQPIKHYLPNYSVTSILRDREGGLWFSTLEDGIFYFPNENITNCNYSFPSNDILRIQATENSLYLVSFDKMFIINGSNPIQNLPDYPSGYCRMLERHGKMVWVSTTLGLMQYDNSKQVLFKEKAYDTEIQKWSRIVPRSVFPLSPHLFFAAADRGIFLYKLSSRGMDSIHMLRSNETPFWEVTKDLTSFSDSGFLAATERGLFLFNFNRKNLVNVNIVDLSLKHPILRARIDLVVRSPYDELFYLGTKEKGLLIWDPKNNVITTLDRTNGLSDNLITSIHFADSAIWVGTKKGINRIVPDKSSPNKYSSWVINKKSGLPSNEINGMAYLNGNMYIATSNGLCYFNPMVITPNRVAPPVHVTKLLINDLPFRTDMNHRLNYTLNDISIEYVGLTYRSLGKVLYRYKMIGIDTNWHYTSNPSVRFPKLKSGTYKFVVSAQNDDGYWSAIPAEVNLTIHPPFWLTIWFQVVLSLFLAGIAIGVYMLRINSITKRNTLKREEEFKRHKLQEELITIRHQALVQQLNPHFVFNALNSIQSLLFENNLDDARNYLTKFAKLMRQILENIEDQNVTIQRELDTLKLYLDLERLRFCEGFDYHITIDPSIDQQRTIIPTMLLQPYIENAINHGIKHKRDSNGIVLISIHREGHTNSLICSIEDNGIGRKQSSKINEQEKNKPKPFGTSITEKRMALINELYGRQLNIHYFDLENEQGEPQGTLVKLSIPFLRR